MVQLGIRRLLWPAALVVMVLVSPAAVPAAASTSTGSPTAWPVENLGEPVHKTLSNEQAIGVAPDGTPEAFFLAQGNNSDETAEFAAVDLRSRQTLFDTRLPAGYGGHVKFSPAEGNVYIGAGAELYRFRPGTTTIEDLGTTLAGEQIWSMAVAANGLVWGGTYPGGDIFSYDPQTRSIHNYGQALSGETYITALEPAGATVYFGTQPDARLGELNPSTGQVTPIALPAQYQNQAGDVPVLQLRGGRLFVDVSAAVSAALVWDVATRSWVDTIPDFSGSAVSPVDPSNSDFVYFRVSAGNVVRYSLSTFARQALPWAPNAFPGDFAWVDLADPNFPGLTLMFTYYTNCRIYGYNFTTGKTYYLEPKVQGAGDPLIVLGEGPNGNVYAGGFQTPPGMGMWDPDKGAWQLLTGSGQVEGYGSYNGNLVFGRYPQGTLYYDDLSRPWSSGTNPGPPVAIGDDQNRPVAFTQVGDQVAVGSVPVSGRLGGDISLWNPTSGAIQVYSDPIANQTPASLVTAGGLVWGGTSINGGYGVSSTTTSAQLFAWDPSSHTVVFSMTPFQNAANVTGLALDGAGHLWGLADSTLFEFDLAGRTIMRSEPLASTVDQSMYGIEHHVLFDAGRLFATTDGQLFHVDTVTWKAQALTGSANTLVQDRYGQLYFIHAASYVYRYDLPRAVFTPVVSASVQRTPGSASVVRLTAGEPNGPGISEIDYRVGDGDWQLYHQPFAVLGRQTVAYRAVDRAWSASQVETVSTGDGN